MTLCLVACCLVACDRGTLPERGTEAEDSDSESARQRSKLDRERQARAQEHASDFASRLGERVETRAIGTIVPSGAEVVACGEEPPGMKCIPGGWFWRGVDDDPHDCDQPGQPRGDEPTTTPRRRVWVSTFFLDESEVTNAAYEACIEAGECPEAGPQYRDFDGPEQAITGVSWFDARAFCRAQGKRLPTEAEFEKSARGPAGETGPFGDEPVTCDQAIIKDDRGRSCGVRRNGPTPLTGRVMPVKSRPAGRYGLYDIAGNAEEWVADWFSRDWASCGDDCFGVDPKGPCQGREKCDGHRNRVVRGGSWYWPASHATGHHRRPHIPSNELFHHFGFRCAKTATDEESTTE